MLIPIKNQTSSISFYYVISLKIIIKIPIAKHMVTITEIAIKIEKFEPKRIPTTIFPSDDPKLLAIRTINCWSEVGKRALSMNCYKFYLKF